MRRALLKVVPRGKAGVHFPELARPVRPHLDVYDPTVSVQWYVVTVEQDLEARGLVEQVPGAPSAPASGGSARGAGRGGAGGRCARG